MKTEHFFTTFAILTIVQILISNYLNLSQFVTLSLLPVIVLCIPLKYGVIPAMLAAFAAGACVDIFSEGLLGLNAAAIVPVAFLRLRFIESVFGSGLFARGENLSLKQHGLFKFSTAILISQAVFLLIYIIADGAGTRPFSFNALRFICSLGAGYLLSIFVLVALTNGKGHGWK